MIKLGLGIDDVTVSRSHARLDLSTDGSVRLAIDLGSGVIILRPGAADEIVLTKSTESTALLVSGERRPPYLSLSFTFHVS